MKCPLNMNKPLSVGFVAFLLLSMAIGVTATPWDGVPDDPTPAQAIWVDPKNTTGLGIGDVFTVNVLVNITSPTQPGGGTGLYGFQYRLKWNSTVLEAVEIQTHTDNVPPPTPDLLPGWTAVFIADNATVNASATEKYHSYAVSATAGVAFTGVASLCTYKFKVLWQPEESEPDFCGLLDIYNEILVDDTATPITAVTVDGMYCVRAKVKPLADFTWSPETPKVGETVTFNASLSTPNGGSIVSYAWNFSDGTPIITEYDPITTHNYTATGTYNVTLTVADSEGLTNSTTKSITIVKTSSTISISASPTTIEIGQNTTISGSITPVRIAANVTIHYRLAGETWNTTVITNSTGGYSYVWTPSELGTYEVKASWPGDATTLGAESSIVTVTVTKASSIISISASPTTIEIGEDTTISGSITPVRVGVNVTIYYRLAGGTWTTLTNVTTVSTGYSYVWTPSELGTYEVKASWPGDATTLGAESSVATVTVTKMSSSISISVSPETIKVGEDTTISGSITPVRVGVTVTIHYRLAGETWNTTTVTTNSTGGYSYTWTPGKAGDYEVYASWPGDTNTEPAESDHKTVTVKEAAAPYLLYAAIVIIIIIVAAIAIYFLKIRKS